MLSRKKTAKYKSSDIDGLTHQLVADHAWGTKYKTPSWEIYVRGRKTLHLSSQNAKR